MLRTLSLFIIILISLPSTAEQTVITRNPVYNRYQVSQPYYKADLFRDIGDLELYIFDKTYCNENNLSRLQRIEVAVFGNIQQGDIYQRYENAKNIIFSHPKPNYKTTLLKNLSDYFTGQMTGYTPSLYPNMYGNTSFTNYSGPYGNRYESRNYANGANSTVRILD